MKSVLNVATSTTFMTNNFAASNDHQKLEKEIIYIIFSVKRMKARSSQSTKSSRTLQLP